MPLPRINKRRPSLATPTRRPPHPHSLRQRDQPAPTSSRSEFAVGSNLPAGALTGVPACRFSLSSVLRSWLLSGLCSSFCLVESFVFLYFLFVPFLLFPFVSVSRLFSLTWLAVPYILLSIFVCLFICLYTHLPICSSNIHSYVWPSVCLFVCVTICLSTVSRPVYPSVYLYVCMLICLYLGLYAIQSICYSYDHLSVNLSVCTSVSIRLWCTSV